MSKNTYELPAMMSETIDEMDRQANRPVNLVEKLAEQCFRMSLREAHEKEICIDCKSRIRIEIGEDETGENGQIYSDAGLREYERTGLCETCFDNITRD